MIEKPDYAISAWPVHPYRPGHHISAIIIATRSDGISASHCDRRPDRHAHAAVVPCRPLVGHLGQDSQSLYGFFHAGFFFLCPTQEERGYGWKVAKKTRSIIPCVRRRARFLIAGMHTATTGMADLNAGVTRITVVTHVMGMTGAYPMDRVCALFPDKVAVSCDGCPVVYWPTHAGQWIAEAVYRVRYGPER